MINQNLKTVVTLGGAVDSSFNKITTTFKQNAGAFQKITSSFNKSMGEASKTVRDLESEQRQLKKAINSTKAAQQQLNQAEKDHADASASEAHMQQQRKDLTRSINAQRQVLKRLDAEQANASHNEKADLSAILARREKLEKQFKQELAKRDKLTAEIRNSTKAQKDYSAKAAKLKDSIKDLDEMENGYRSLEHQIAGAKRELDGFNKATSLGRTLKTVATTGAAATAVIWGTGAAVTGLMTTTNAATAQTVSLSKAYDMSIQRFKAWGGIAKQAGFDGETVGDLIEELSNKFGEFKVLGEQSTVSDVFGALGLDAAMLDGMSAADQFEFIMKRLESVQDKQQAASLADQLFGGEANKILMYTRNTGQSIDQLLGKQHQLNQLTDQGAKGATAYGQSYNALNTVITSAWQEISGIVGGEMASDIDHLSTTVATFVRTHKKEIVSTVKSLVYGTKDAAVAVYQLVTSVNTVVQSFGGWSTVGAVVAGLVASKLVAGVASFVSTGVAMVSMLGTAQKAMFGLNVVMTANPIGLIVVAIGTLVTAGILLYQNLDTVTGWIGRTVDWLGDKFGWIGTVIKTVFDFSPLGMVVNHWQPISGFFTSLWDGITKLFDDRIAKIKTVINSVTGWFKKLTFWDQDNTAPRTVVSMRGQSAKTSATKGQSSPRTVVPIRRQTATASPASSSSSTQAASRVGRAAAALRNAKPASKANVVNQTIGDIHVTAAPGQSAQDVAKAIHQKLGGHRNGALYDLAEVG